MQLSIKKIPQLRLNQNRVTLIFSRVSWYAYKISNKLCNGLHTEFITFTFLKMPLQVIVCRYLSPACDTINNFKCIWRSVTTMPTMRAHRQRVFSPFLLCPKLCMRESPHKYNCKCTVSAGKNFTRQYTLFRYMYQATFYTNILPPIVINGFYSHFDQKSVFSTIIMSSFPWLLLHLLYKWIKLNISQHLGCQFYELFFRKNSLKTHRKSIRCSIWQLC